MVIKELLYICFKVTFFTLIHFSFTMEFLYMFIFFLFCFKTLATPKAAPESLFTLVLCSLKNILLFVKLRLGASGSYTGGLSVCMSVCLSVCMSVGLQNEMLNEVSRRFLFIKAPARIFLGLSCLYACLLV